MSTQSDDTILIVLHPFGSYTKGQLISDPDVIAGILSGGQRSRVVVTRRPDTLPAAKTEF